MRLCQLLVSPSEERKLREAPRKLGVAAHPAPAFFQRKQRIVIQRHMGAVGRNTLCSLALPGVEDA